MKYIKNEDPYLTLSGRAPQGARGLKYTDKEETEHDCQCRAPQGARGLK